MGRSAGLSVAEIERIPDGPEADGWTGRQAAILSATDELHDDGMISDATWQALASHLDEKLLVELCFLVGHYEMLAMTISSLGIQPEAPRPEAG
jgi:alkylhydroperoxidase family enzyme